MKTWYAISMKATKDKDGTTVWEQENDNPEPMYSGKPMEKVEDKPTRLDKLKERQKELASQEKETEGF
jgi:hypothetical protein